MDGESSYESDISESWSLIDINLNVESLSATEVPSELETSPVPELKKVKLKRLSETELDDFVRKCKEINQTDFSQVSDSDSDSSFKIQELPVSSRTKLDGIYFSSKSLENNSDDAESIEILDIEGNYQDSEVDKFDVSGIDQLSTYQSDDEESLEGRSYFESRSNSSTVIKRVKRNECSSDTVYSINSESISLGESNLSDSLNNSKEESLQLIVESNKANGHSVYKHYRNNVANTVLSLSVGVIFAGVACIAIGHFLGVQDASENAVELIETLKKLQAENAALQSRLFHLNRALLTREMTPKLELPLDQQNGKVSCEESSHVDSSKELREDQKTNLNNAAISEICSSLNSIEWLSRLQNFVRKNRVTNPEYEIDFKRFGKFIQDQLHSFNNGNADGIKLLEDTDKKLSKVLQNIISQLSSSQDHIENFYDRLIKFKDKLNHKFKKIFPRSLKEFKPESELKTEKVPVTEFDLQTINWGPEKKLEGSSDKPHQESVLSYKFSQPENYCETDRDIISTPEEVFGVTNSSGIVENKITEKEVKQKKKHKSENKKKKEKKQSKNDWKEKKVKEKKGEKKRKRAVHKVHKMQENFRNKNVFVGPKHFSDENAFNETFFESKKDLKFKDNNVKSKRKLLKKNSKLRKVLTKPKRRSHLKRKRFDRMCSASECFNVTGYWVFKWAGGREEIRRHETLGDWQFERAKARKELRDEEGHEENWQFKRALARETNRNDDHLHRKKYDKYVGNKFFHDRFSWI